MHFFVVIYDHPPWDAADLERLSADALDYAIHHKGGLPRGMQTGTITFPIFIQASPLPEPIAWAEKHPSSRWAAMLLPVLADPDARRLYWYRDRLAKGSYFERDMHDTIETLIAPALGTHRPLLN